MSVRNLHHAFRPRSVAVFGASARPGSVGNVVLSNLIEAGFAGPVWPVNPNHAEILGRPCYPDAAALPEAPDLAVIATPAATVPQIVSALGEKGTRAALVITAGLTRANGLRGKMLEAARPHLLRIIGPNTLGLMVPSIGLDAGFSHMRAAPGNLALLSQSGAIATSLIDWAAERGVGFSQIVSLGDMADVDVGDCLDMLAGDEATRAVLVYLETIPSPRKFMSAARAAARVKPVILVKAGRHQAAAKAAATHTGALSGGDRVVEAALRRAGILRVSGLADLFEAAETLSRFSPLEEARIGIVTNGGGAGVLAIDQMMEKSGSLATLSEATLSGLDSVLPANWSRANPVDIIGDAPPERYRAAVEAVAADPGTDALLVMNCPTALASPLAAAEGLAGMVENGTLSGKPVLACWLGERTARPARERMQQAGIASFATPSAAGRALSYLDGWSRALKSLSRVPATHALEHAPHRREAAAILQAAAAENRALLTEPEAKAVLAAYGIPVPETRVADTPEAARQAATDLLVSGGKVVVKLLSRDITHKSDVGGVVLGLETPQAAEEAARAILDRARRHDPAARLDGVVVQPMVAMSKSHELILGLDRDPVFGPVILFGAGGVSVEVVDDTAIALPPLDDVLAGDLIDRTRVGRLLEGFRDRPPADRPALLAALEAVSAMIVDFPAISAMDINPLLAGPTGVCALDARIEIDPARALESGPNPDLAIRPYPARWEKTVAVPGGLTYVLRPARPADAALAADFLAALDPAERDLLASRPGFSDAAFLRLTQIDYDREMSLLALDPAGALAGVARLATDPDRERADLVLLLADEAPGHALLSHLLAVARAEGIARVEGRLSPARAGLYRALGFTLRDEAGAPAASLAL